MSFLTDRNFASGVSVNDLIHIVITGDTSQNPAGSSYKTTLGDVISLVTGITGNYLPISGGTVTGTTFFISGLSANTFSASTIGSSGSCVDDLYVSNIHSCSPLNINPFDEGEVLFGSNKQIFVDLVGKKVGFNMTPTYNIDAMGTTNGRFFFRGASLPSINISGTSNSYVSTNTVAGNVGLLSVAFGESYPSNLYGVVSGNTLLTNTNESNDMVILTNQSSTNDKNIKFFAGKSADTKPDIIILGSGSGLKRGYVGVGLNNPQEHLHVDGNSIINQGLTAATFNISTAPNIDTNVPTEYLTRDASTGEVKIKQIPGPTVFGLFAQTGNSVVISGTTVESTLIDGGVGTLSVPANGFSIGDSFRADFGGLMSVKPGGDTLRIRIKTGSVILGDTGVLSVPAVTNDVWLLNINFTVRKLGGPTFASIVSLGNLHVIKAASTTPTSFAFNTVNSSTFDTTISNTLDVTAEWGSNSTNNKIYSDIFVLNKIY